MSEPKISVVVFTHNRPGELDRFVESMLEQTLQEWELLIVDESEESYSSKYVDEDSRIKVFFCYHHHDWGYTNKEETSKYARSEWLTFPNDDHIYRKDFLEKMTKASHDLDVDCVLCDFKHRSLGHVKAHPTICSVDIGTFIIKKSVFEEHKFFDKGKVGDGKFIETINRHHNVVCLHEELVECP